jgi:hypothetical protein
MLKGCAVGCFSVVALVVLVVGGVFWMTSGVVDAANAALTLCGQGKIAEAYAGTTSGFKGRTSAQAFEKMIQTARLDRFVTASWSSRSIKNGRGRVAGTATLKDAPPVYLVVTLSKEAGAWKVDGIYPEAVEATSTPSAEEEPAPK